MKKIRCTIRSALFLILVSLMAGDVSADFYKYTAEDGSVHFVDDISKIPPPLRNRIESYRETAADFHTPTLGSEFDAGTREDTATGEDPGTALFMETPVKVFESHVLVPVRLGDGRNEIEVMMVMDTGSAKMVLHRKVANQLYLGPLDGITMVAADGRRVPTEIGMIGTMELGPFTLANVPTVIMPDDNEIGYSGLLGFEVLKNFNYTVDFQREVIRWEALPGRK